MSPAFRFCTHPTGRWIRKVAPVREVLVRTETIGDELQNSPFRRSLCIPGRGKKGGFIPHPLTNSTFTPSSVRGRGSGVHRPVTIPTVLSETGVGEHELRGRQKVCRGVGIPFPLPEEMLLQKKKKKKKILLFYYLNQRHTRRRIPPKTKRPDHLPTHP